MQIGDVVTIGDVKGDRVESPYSPAFLDFKKIKIDGKSFDVLSVRDLNGRTERLEWKVVPAKPVRSRKKPEPEATKDDNAEKVENAETIESDAEPQAKRSDGGYLRTSTQAED